MEEAAGDRELLEAVASGDQLALKELLERHRWWLAARLTQRTPDPDLVDSALQDTFVTVWRDAARYRGDGDVGAWLWGIAVRRLVDRLRVKAPPVPVTSQVVSALVPAVRSAEDELLLAVEHGDLGQALATLPPDLQRVVQAMVLDGLTAREAGRLLALPTGTVKSRLRTAKARLREQLIILQGAP